MGSDRPPRPVQAGGTGGGRRGREERRRGEKQKHGRLIYTRSIHEADVHDTYEHQNGMYKIHTKLLVDQMEREHSTVQWVNSVLVKLLLQG